MLVAGLGVSIPNIGLGKMGQLSRTEPDCSAEDPQPLQFSSLALTFLCGGWMIDDCQWAKADKGL